MSDYSSKPPSLVLLVDGEADNLGLYRRSLASSCNVLTASSVTDALEHARMRGEEIDVVVTDQVLPDGTGTDLLRGLQEVAPWMPTVVVASYLDATTTIEAVNQGWLFSLLLKPVSPDAVATTVQQAANERSRRRRSIDKLGRLRRENETLQDGNAELKNVAAELSLRNMELSAEHQSLEQAYKEMAELVFRDELTNLFNRRRFHELLVAEFHRFSRYRHPTTLMLLDLDHFKAVNDRFGHPTGDTVLKDVAQHLLGAARKSDIVFRIGGDEFAVLLPETKEKDAERVGHRCRAAVQGMEQDGQNLGLDLSFGAVCLGFSLADAQAWYREADAKLYREKAVHRRQSKTDEELAVGWLGEPLELFEELAERLDVFCHVDVDCNRGLDVVLIALGSGREEEQLSEASRFAPDAAKVVLVPDQTEATWLTAVQQSSVSRVVSLPATPDEVQRVLGTVGVHLRSSKALERRLLSASDQNTRLRAERARLHRGLEPRDEDSLPVNVFPASHLADRVGEEVVRANRYGYPLSMLVASNSVGFSSARALDVAHVVRTVDPVSIVPGERVVVLMPVTRRPEAEVVGRRVGEMLQRNEPEADWRLQVFSYPEDQAHFTAQ